MPSNRRIIVLSRFRAFPGSFPHRVIYDAVRNRILVQVRIVVYGTWFRCGHDEHFPLLRKTRGA